MSITIPIGKDARYMSEDEYQRELRECMMADPATRELVWLVDPLSHPGAPEIVEDIKKNCKCPPWTCRHTNKNFRCGYCQKMIAIDDKELECDPEGAFGTRRWTHTCEQLLDDRLDTWRKSEEGKKQREEFYQKYSRDMLDGIHCRMPDDWFYDGAVTKKANITKSEMAPEFRTQCCVCKLWFETENESCRKCNERYWEELEEKRKSITDQEELEKFLEKNYYKVDDYDSDDECVEIDYPYDRECCYEDCQHWSELSTADFCNTWIQDGTIITDQYEDNLEPQTEYARGLDGNVCDFCLHWLKVEKHVS